MDYDFLQAEIERLATKKTPLVVAIDGHSAAGKSTLSERLSRSLAVSLIHGDDFYAPMDSGTRSGLSAVEGVDRYFDWQRMRAEAIEPLSKGLDATFSPYDWEHEQLGTTSTTITASPVIIVEGVYSARPELAGHIDLAVLVEATDPLRQRRQDARGNSGFWRDRWAQAELYYFENLKPPETFDIRVSGAPEAPSELRTKRLTLRRWRVSDRSDFARLNADVEVMADMGGPISRAESDAKLDRYMAAFATSGITRWVVQSHEGEFLGYCGVMPVDDSHPLGAHHDIGWRLVREAWGHGYATEAASVALADALDRHGLSRVLAYTAESNSRSQSVMEKLRLRREPSLDFGHSYDGHGRWAGLVWVADASEFPGGIDPGRKSQFL